MPEANHRVEDTNIALRAITGHKGAGANFLTARLLDSSPYLPNDGYRGRLHQAVALRDILAGLIGCWVAGALPEQVAVIDVKPAAGEAERSEKITEPVHLILTLTPRRSTHIATST